MPDPKAHKTDCSAYNTKGRELSDRPCTCGARNPKAAAPSKPKPVCGVCFREHVGKKFACAKCDKRLANSPPERDGMNPDSAEYWDDPAGDNL